MAQVQHLKLYKHQQNSNQIVIQFIYNKQKDKQMGGFTSKTQEDLKLYLDCNYDITNFPSIQHKINKKKAMVHHITTDSTEQAHRIRSDVNMYHHIHCQSISKILQYVPLQSNKLCSQQEYHYIVEEDLQKYTLRQQFLARKYFKQKFSDRELVEIVKTFLCGLNVYHSKFHRKFNGLITLDAITVDEERANHMRLTDPLLMAETASRLSTSPGADAEKQHPNRTYAHKVFLDQDQNTIRQAPEKAQIKKAKFNQDRIQFNQLSADLYMVGIVILQLHRMQPFSKSQKRDILMQQIDKISNRQVQKVVSQLTAQHSQDRQKVYETIKVAPQQLYHLQRCFKKGNVFNKDTSQTSHLMTTSKFVDVPQLNMQDKQGSLSFGTSQLHMPILTRPAQSYGIQSHYQSQLRNVGLSPSLEKGKNQTTSNMSTDRTFLNCKPPISAATSVVNRSSVTYNNESNSSNHNNNNINSNNNYNHSNTNNNNNFNHNKTNNNINNSNNNFNHNSNNNNTNKNYSNINNYNNKNINSKVLASNEINVAVSRPLVKFNNSNHLNSIGVNPHNTVSPRVSPFSRNVTNSIFHSHPNDPAIDNNSTGYLIGNQLQNPRSNSFLIHHDKNPLSRESEYSPFKKQQDISPLSQKSHSLVQESNFKNIFDKYSHLNYEASNSTYSPNTVKQINKMQDEMNRLLKQPYNKQKQDLHNGHINNLSPTPNGQRIESSISVMEHVQLSMFTVKENTFKRQTQSVNKSQEATTTKLQQINKVQTNMKRQANINSQQTFNARQHCSINQDADKEQMPTYRPNKQVEQILKRLGIGSLLYGNEQNDDSKEQQQSVTAQNNPLLYEQQQQIYRGQDMTPGQQEQDIYIHKVSYNISGNNANGYSNGNSNNRDNGIGNNGSSNISNDRVKQHFKSFQQQQGSQQAQPCSDICDRETTPIRPVKSRNKYNSTIVEVGDQDSQYSSSEVRNKQADLEMDMTDHEYVVEEYQTGSKYEGYKLSGLRDGHGKFHYQDGGFYEGQWKNNKMDGWGKLFYEGGKLAYEGNWCQDQFHGFGKVYNDNPILLECGFDFTNFDLLQDFWEYYEGMLIKDTKQGRGKIKLTNDQVFEGDFQNDRIQGFGKFLMKEGTMIEGIWRDSKLIKIISS